MSLESGPQRGPGCRCCAGKDKDRTSLAAGYVGVVNVTMHIPPKLTSPHVRTEDIKRAVKKLAHKRPKPTKASFYTHRVLVIPGVSGKLGKMRLPRIEDAEPSTME